MKFSRIFLFTMIVSVLSAAGFAATAGHKRVNLNQAKLADLKQVTGLSAYRAHSILSYRKKHGKFKSMDDLRQVKGFKRIKKEKLQKLTQQLSLS